MEKDKIVRVAGKGIMISSLHMGIVNDFKKGRDDKMMKSNLVLAL